MTIPAVGPVTALAWALEVGDVRRFSSIKKAISNDCPAFQRRHMSLFCTAESPNRFPWVINTTFESSFIPDGVASTG